MSPESVPNNSRPLYNIKINQEHAKDMFSKELVNVLELIVDGMSLKQIVEERKTSIKTIYNQINGLVGITREETKESFSRSGLIFQLLKIGVLELEAIEYPKELE